MPIGYGDGICDDECNNADCGYDGGDCGPGEEGSGTEECAPGCEGGWPGDEICDDECNNAECNFDGGDCTPPLSPPPGPPPGPPPPASVTCQCGKSGDYPPISGAWFSSPDCSGAPTATWALPFFPVNEESAGSINVYDVDYCAGSWSTPTTQRSQWCDYSVEPPQFRGERIVGDDCSSTTMVAFSDPADGTCVSNGERGSHRIYCGAAIRSVECVASAECASECMASCESAGLEAGEESADLVGVIVGATVGGLAALILAIALPIVVICCCRKKATAAPPSTAVPATQGVAMPVAKSAPATEQASIEA